jgi:uncharacterized protein YbbK (DUF523 family)
MRKPRYIVSACLIGKHCRYNGEDKAHAGVLRFLRGKRYVAVCPEMLAGWGVPRPPVEFHGGGAAELAEGEARIVDNRGRDRTPSLMRGIKKALAKARSLGVRGAVLKERSPSCGVHKVYQNGELTRGQGLFTYWLRKHGVEVRSEENVAKRGGERG